MERLPAHFGGILELVKVMGESLPDKIWNVARVKIAATKGTTFGEANAEFFGGSEFQGDFTTSWPAADY